MTMHERRKECNTMVEEISIEELIRSIDSKCEGTKQIDILTVTIREHDMRKERDIESKAKDILRDGIRNPIHINVVNGVNRTVDGKTRASCFGLEGYTTKYIKRWGSTVIEAKVYRNLTTEEEDYLDVTLNSSQRELTPDEKQAYVDKYAGRINRKELAKILNVRVTQVDQYIATSNEPEENRVIKNGRVNTRDTSIVSRLNVVDQSLKSIIAKGKFSQSDRSEYDYKEVVKRSNRRIAVKEITGEDEETIVRQEVEKQQNGVPNRYQSMPFVPKGSEGKYSAWERLLEKEAPEEIIILNIETNDWLVLEATKEAQKSMALIGLEHAKVNDCDIILADNVKSICNTWRKKHPTVTIHEKMVERYLIELLTPSSKKTVLLIHMSGGFTSRNILGEHELRDIFLDRPNCVIVAIYNRKWYTDVTKRQEQIIRWGHRYARKNPIETLEQYLNADVEHNIIPLEWNIEWEKLCSRDVALVSWRKRG